MAVAAPLLLFAFPESVAAHQLNERYEAPLPLIAYLAGAALAVAMSFLFVIVRKPSGRDATAREAPQRRARQVPAWLRYGLQGLGLLAWAWILVQTFFGGSG